MLIKKDSKSDCNQTHTQFGWRLAILTLLFCWKCFFNPLLARKKTRLTKGSRLNWPWWSSLTLISRSRSLWQRKTNEKWIDKQVITIYFVTCQWLIPLPNTSHSRLSMIHVHILVDGIQWWQSSHELVFQGTRPIKRGRRRRSLRTKSSWMHNKQASKVFWPNGVTNHESLYS